MSLTAEQARPTARYTVDQLRALDATAVSAVDLDAAVDLLDGGLAAIVGRPQPGRERVALLLSGGIDSVLSLALLVRAGYSPECFTAFGADSSDAAQAELVASALGVPWTPVELTDADVRARLEAVVGAIGYWGLWSVASGLLLDALLRAVGAAGIPDAWSGSGLDLAFGRPAGDREVEPASDPVNVCGTVAAVHDVRMRMPFEGIETAQLARRIDPALLRDAAGAGKVPLRRLAERLGVPAELAARPREPFQRSSGMFALLERLMREDAARWCPNALDCAPGEEADDRDLGLRYFVARVAFGEGLVETPEQQRKRQRASSRPSARGRPVRERPARARQKERSGSVLEGQLAFDDA